MVIFFFFGTLGGVTGVKNVRPPSLDIYTSVSVSYLIDYSVIRKFYSPITVSFGLPSTHSWSLAPGILLSSSPCIAEIPQVCVSILVGY